MLYIRGKAGSGLLAVYLVFTCLMVSTSDAKNCSERDCPPWFFAKNNVSDCEFGPELKEVIQREGNLSLVDIGYCVTHENETENETYLISCPYDIAKDHAGLVRGHRILLDTPLFKLNNFTCDQFNREDSHCARCKESYGQSVFTMDLGCYSCTKSYRGWGLYLFLEIVLLTGFLILLFLFRLSPTKPSIKALVLFSQIVMFCLSLNYEPPYKHAFRSKASTLVRIIKTCYGFWNLDFFRSLIPPFCVDDGLNNFEVLSFHYISIIYPTMLTAVIWIIVDLHERGCKPVVRMWKPFRTYLSHYSVTNDPKRTIISSFATIIILSYTKVIHISASLLNVATVHTVCGTESKNVMFLQPNVKYFGKEHAPFVILASVMSFTFVLVPLLILLLYPIGCVQDKLKSFCVKHKNIQTFVEVFQECYTDGTNGTKDRRLFSTLYLFHRILVVLVLVKGVGTIQAYMITAFIHGVIVGLLFGFKPYKQDAYNYLDILFFFVFAVAFLFAGFMTNNSVDPKVTDAAFAGIFLAMLVPFFYASIRVLMILIKWVKLVDMKAFIQRRRRGYIEISEYGNEQSVSMREPERNQNEHRRRTRGKDSLQSE